MPTNIEIGHYLAHLRSQAGIKQAELAKRVTYSPALISRVESGERAATPDELNAILETIGTEEALRLGETIGRQWRHLPRPPLGHPEDETLWDAEQACQRVNELAESPDVPHPFARRLAETLNELRRLADLVSKGEYDLAFVGDIGVGKSTAICRLADLQVIDERNGQPRPVLEAGGGGVTLCEVQVVQGPEYGMIVEPRSEAELYTEIREFAHSFLSTMESGQDAKDEEPGFAGTSAEMQRVIRNMSGLTVKRRTLADRTRERIDPIRDLATTFQSPDDFAIAIRAKMNLAKRTRREIWCPDSDRQAPLSWLAKVFGEVNNGRHPEFSAPSRIEVILPQRILGDTARGVQSIRLIDTKGIDSTAERADLEAHFGNPSAIVVVCSSFNNAPSPSVQQLFIRAANGGFSNITKQSAVLVLPRPSEALAVKDDEGYQVDTVDEGYELKQDQMVNSLCSLGLADVPVKFFNAQEDDHQGVIDALLDVIKRLRSSYVTELEKVIGGAHALVDNHANEQVRAVQHQAVSPLKTWVNENRTITPVAARPEKSLLDAIETVRYASSLHASIRRQGEWYNLDYAHQLSYGARAMAVVTLSPRLETFRSLAHIQLKTPHLKDASDLIEQSLRVFESGCDSLYQDCQLLGRTIYAEHLAGDPNLWNTCQREWGRGPGYKNRVHGHHTEWFGAHREQIDELVNALIKSKWRKTLEDVSMILEVN